MEEKKAFVHRFPDLEKEVTRLADSIFDTPEFGYHEDKSVAALINFLEKEGFTVEKNVAGIPTAFKAVFGQGRPIIGFLAEYDALGGLSQEAGVLEPKPVAGCQNGHGCGHHLLGSGCAFAGVLVKRYLEETGMQGSVVVFGCPAEEYGSGKAFMAREGVFKGIDAAFTWHPAEYICVVPSSTMSNINVQYTFTGIASHASSAPHMGRSALDAVELMNVGCNYLREHIPRDAQLHYAISDAGGLAPNVVQAHASVVYLLRAPHIEEVLKLKERVDNVARGAALMTGTAVDIHVNKACSHFLPNGVLGNEIYQSIQEVGLPSIDPKDIAFAKAVRETTPTKEESSGMVKNMLLRAVPPKKKEAVAKAFAADINLLTLPLPKMNVTLPGSSDCGDVSLNCPTVWLNYVTYAQGTPTHSWQAVAQGKAALAHKGMIQAAKTLAHTAMKLFEQEDILQKAWEEFLQDTKGKEYISPIPKEVKIPM